MRKKCWYISNFQGYKAISTQPHYGAHCYGSKKKALAEAKRRVADIYAGVVDTSPLLFMPKLLWLNPRARVQKGKR